MRTWLLAGTLLAVAMAGCSGHDDLGDWKVTSVLHGDLTPPQDCPNQGEVYGNRTSQGVVAGPDSHLVYTGMPEYVFHTHAIIHVVVSDNATGAPEEVPFDWRHHPEYLTIPDGGGVHMHGEAPYLHWHGKCVPLQQALEKFDIHLTADSLVVGPSHGAFAGSYGKPVVVVNLFHDARAIVVDNLADYLRMQPHDGSRILITTQAEGQKLLDLANQAGGFHKGDEPQQAPSGGLA